MLRQGQYFVYILRCSDGTYYTGCTNNLKKRIKEHNKGSRGAKYLRGRTPAKLVWSKELQYHKKAVQLEMMVKKMTRGQKQRLVSDAK